jgi:hypothetical protein
MDSGIYPWKKLFIARHSLTIKFSIWARRRTKLASPWYLTTGWVLPDGNIKTSRSCSHYGSSTHQKRVKWYRNFLSPQALSLIVYEPWQIPRLHGEKMSTRCILAKMPGISYQIGRKRGLSNSVKGCIVSIAQLKGFRSRSSWGGCKGRAEA